MFSKTFSGLGKEDANIAGGKGASLGEMLNAGIPVPDGFVILADTFEAFLKDTDLSQEIDAILHTVDHEAVHTVDAASEKIRALIETREIPEAMKTEILSEFKKLGAEFVAVRSSATAEDGADHAWAGQLETYLNTTEKDLLTNVKLCWSSLFTPRAIFYRFEKKLHGTQISVAVVVQKMVNSEKSGIAFSVHPVTEDYNQLIIEAGLGLGEAIVSGSVTPDAYVVEKEPRRVIDTNVSHQTRALYRGEAGDNVWVDLDEEKAAMQVLSEKEVLELSELIIHIEKHYGFPCDIEWAYEGGKFYITQSRPITTLSPKDESSSASNIHPVKDHLRVADYELTFEGQGMTYIYEIALHKHYLPPVSVSVVTKGVVQEFMALKSLEAMDEKGLHTKPEDIQNGIQEMDAAIASARKEMEQILSAPLDAQSIKEAFKLSARIAKAYYFFDPHFWNSLYELSKTDATAKKSVDLVQEYKNVAREYFNEVYFGNGYIPRLIQKMSDVSEVSVEDLFQYSEDELCELMEGTKVADKIIAERKELFVMIKDGDSKRAILSKEDGMHFVESFFAGVEKAKVTTAFHGKSAHTTGKKVRGQVCLITRDYTDEARMQKEMEAMQKGDILVTQTTDPEMMPALRKAAAAVTDIGGMLSHTAITARELNIPCIVDTKIATQVLKNGDLVEVDADTGTVTLVK